jgi:hypothetical protein
MRIVVMFIVSACVLVALADLFNMVRLTFERWKDYGYKQESDAKKSHATEENQE